MANETVHTISRSNKIVSRYLKNVNKNSIIHVEHIISDPEKATCYSSPTYGMAKETGRIISEPSRLANNFLYHDKLVPLLRDGQREKT